MTLRAHDTQPLKIPRTQMTRSTSGNLACVTAQSICYIHTPGNRHSLGRRCDWLHDFGAEAALALFGKCEAEWEVTASVRKQHIMRNITPGVDHATPHLIHTLHIA
jgi:hypothetical protein